MIIKKDIPIRNDIIKKYSQPRGAYIEPLLPRLRKDYCDTYAVGFNHKLIASDDDFYSDTPIGFVRFK